MPEIENAYRDCLAMARSHYENFPVASFALPKAMRRPISVIYAFARTADDFADEGDRTASERLALLDDYSDKLSQLEQGQRVDHSIFIALEDVVKQHQLPWQLFHDLLTAFKMDVTTKRYASFDDLLYYCRHSANPVGRLLLYLYKQALPQHLQWSDQICSALQLINFWQDLEQDLLENNRIYIPQDELTRFGISEADMRKKNSSDAMQKLMTMQIQRSRNMLYAGAPLAYAMKGRFGLELRLTVHGGAMVLNALERQTNVYARPRLSKRDWISMLFWRIWRPLR